MLWLGLMLLTLVHWLLGHALARLLMFMAMMGVVWCVAVADLPLRPSFFWPDLIAFGFLAWLLSGIPRRYRIRRDAARLDPDEFRKRLQYDNWQLQQLRQFNERMEAEGQQWLAANPAAPRMPEPPAPAPKPPIVLFSRNTWARQASRR
jgi:hypothetical protein